MIKLSLGQYRSISEPFATLLSSNKIPFTEIPNSSALLLEINGTQLQKVSDIASYLSKNFASVFITPVNVIASTEPSNIQEAILSVHSSILSK